MIKNYFKTALRGLWKNKTTSFINLLGLSIGMTAAVFIFLWVQNEMTFDNYHPHEKNIYRISSTIPVSKDENWKWEGAPMLMAETAIKEIPGLQNTARIILNTWAQPVINIDHKIFSEKNSAYVDKSWFNMFHYDFVAGNAAAFAKDPFSIILTVSKAKKYFGNADATGRVIRVDTINYTVQGVIKDNPLNSSFQFDVLMQMDARLSDAGTYKNDKSWNNFGYITFLELRPDANIADVSKKLNDVINKSRAGNTSVISLEPLKDMYFENDLQSSDMPHGSEKTAYIFSLLGLLLLMAACINYVNLTTAKAGLRAKEISVRKIVGAQRAHLFFQFIAESLIISFISLAITVILIQVSLPAFNSITEKYFELPITSINMWKVLLGTLLFATVLNGIYPAILLSSFKPLNVFRGKTMLRLRDGSIRKGLVVFQFSLSMILIITAMVIYKQLQFIQTTNPGYNVSQVMSFSVPYKSYSKLNDSEKQMFFDAFKHNLQSLSSIQAVCTGSDEIVNVTSASSGNADWDGHDTTFNPTIAKLRADAGFQKMFGLQVASGRWFKDGNEDAHNYILNETAIQQLGIHTPVIGQRFTWGGDTGQIIGVVNDFHFKSMHDKIGPMVLTNNQNEGSAYFFIKTGAENIPETVNNTATMWAKYFPAEPFNFSFLDDSFNSLYKSDIKTSQLIFIFSVIAVLISALGLFGLAAFTAEQRTKEIGIRKVLGASVQQITTLLSKEFIKLVVIAITIGFPVAYWAMSKWLQDFAYRVNITVWIFLAASAFVIFIAILSVSMQAIKAAIANPVKSLRTE